jgi:hypothetical protein
VSSISRKIPKISYKKVNLIIFIISSLTICIACTAPAQANLQEVAQIPQSGATKASCISNNYMYCILQDSPPTLSKWDLDTFALADSLTLSNGDSVRKMLVVGEYLYFGEGTGYSTVTRISLTDFTIADSLNCSSYLAAVNDLCTDGTYLYVASDVGLYKLDLVNFSVSSSTGTYFTAIAYQDGFLYGCNYNQLHKIDPAKLYISIADVDLDNNANSIKIVGEYAIASTNSKTLFVCNLSPFSLNTSLQNSGFIQYPDSIQGLDSYAYCSILGNDGNCYFSRFNTKTMSFDEALKISGNGIGGGSLTISASSIVYGYVGDARSNTTGYFLTKILIADDFPFPTPSPTPYVSPTPSTLDTPSPAPTSTPIQTSAPSPTPIPTTEPTPTLSPIFTAAPSTTPSTSTSPSQTPTTTPTPALTPSSSPTLIPTSAISPTPRPTLNPIISPSPTILPSTSTLPTNSLQPMTTQSPDPTIPEIPTGIMIIVFVGIVALGTAFRKTKTFKITHVQIW